MTDAHIQHPDAELVAGHLAGDRAAFAAIYDKYADNLYDVAAAMLRNRHDAADVTQDTFVIAAERMAQLRDPSRLKPWLLAILRNEVYRRSGKRAKQVPTDFTLVGADMGLPPVEAEEADHAEYEELARLVREAAAGLDDRDQLVLELTVRQGLEGDDLASALGVTPQQSYSLVHRMRQRTERSLGAFCVARRGRKECPDLDKILAGWDGEFSVLIRKRVARHIDDCNICERNRKKFVPLALFGSAPAFAAPPELRDRVLAAAQAGPLGLTGTAPATRPYGFDAAGGFPGPLQYSRTVVMAWLAAAAVLMLAIGVGVFVLAGRDDGAPQLAIDMPDVPTSTTTPPTSTTTTTSTSVPVVAPVTSSSTSTTSTTEPTETSAPTTEPTVTTERPHKTTTTSTSTTTTLPFETTTVPEVVPTPTPTPDPTPDATTTTTAPTTSTTTAPTTSTTTTVPPTPASLRLSSGSLDFGDEATSLQLTLSNTGDQSAAWTVSVGPAGWLAGESAFSVSPNSGTLAGGESQTVTVTFDRSGTPGEYSAAIKFGATGTSAQLTATATIPAPPPVDTTAPVVDIVATGGGCAGPYLTVETSDAGGPASPQPVGTVTDAAGLSYPITFGDHSGTTWYGWTNLQLSEGPYSFTAQVSATDDAGNTGSDSATITFRCVP